MPFLNSRIFFLILILVSLGRENLFSQEKCSFYYFSIGSQDYGYSPNQEMGFIGFSNLEYSNYSAKIFSYSCKKLGSKKGVLLASSKKRPLTKEVILSNLGDFIKVIKKEKSKNKLLLIYYCGHGIGEKETQMQFAMPSDFLYNYEKKFNNDPLNKYAINQNSIKSIIQKLDGSLQFLILFDCCYELSAENITINNIDSSESETLKTNKYGSHKYQDVRNQTIFWALRDLSITPIIVASQPGKSINFVSSPLVEDKLCVGPLSRRFYLAVEQLENNSILLSDLVRMIKDKNLDLQTNPPYIRDGLEQTGVWQDLLSLKIK